MLRHTTLLKKVDDELQIVWGEVYVPGFPDSQGDFMVSEEIRKMAHAFMAAGHLHKVDVQHDGNIYGSYVVESFIAREGDPTFIADSWVVGVHIPNGALWEMVKSGELNGFSMEAFAQKQSTTIDIDIPPTVDGMTTETDGHAHTFKVAFSPDGEFLGGRTGPADDGHFHMIAKGSVTESVDDHNHRFSFIEGVLDNAA